MQQTDATYKSLLKDPGAIVESRVDVNGRTYGDDKIVSMRTIANLCSDTPSFGNSNAREIEVTLFDVPLIKRDGKKLTTVNPYLRLVLKDAVTGKVEKASDWIPKGKFFVDSLDQDLISGQVSIHGYDALMKFDQTLEEAGIVEISVDYKYEFLPAYECSTTLIYKKGSQYSNIHVQPTWLYSNNRLTVPDSKTILASICGALGIKRSAASGNNKQTGNFEMDLLKLTGTDVDTVYEGLEEEPVDPYQYFSKVKPEKTKEDMSEDEYEKYEEAWEAYRDAVEKAHDSYIHDKIDREYNALKSVAELTIRDVMKHIAIVSSGNWMMDDMGELKLVSLYPNLVEARERIIEGL